MTPFYTITAEANETNNNDIFLTVKFMDDFDATADGEKLADLLGWENVGVKGNQIVVRDVPSNYLPVVVDVIRKSGLYFAC